MGDVFSKGAAVNLSVRAGGIVEPIAAGNWMRTDKATRTKEGAASSQPMGEGRQMNVYSHSNKCTITLIHIPRFFPIQINAVVLCRVYDPIILPTK